jgi:glutaminase
VLELQGSLYFSSIEQVLRRITDEMSSFSYLILDLKRISQIDESAVRLLRQTDEMLGSKNKTLVLAHAPDHCSALFEAGQTSCALADIDSALEWCEDRLLQQAAPELLRDDRQVTLAAMDIMRDFTSSEIALVETILQEARYVAGEMIIREGDHADSLFLLARGRVSICLSIKSGSRRQRLSTIGPGLAFGELALLDGGRRSADVIAEEPTLCYCIPIAKLQALGECHPEIERKLIFNIAREVTARLRRADAEIRSLAD